jgi:hypothetical protein
MTIAGFSEVTDVSAELNEVEVGKGSCGTSAGTLNRPVVLQKGEYLALDLDAGNQGGGRN